MPLKVYKKAASLLPPPSFRCQRSSMRRHLSTQWDKEDPSRYCLCQNFAASSSLRNERCVLPALYNRHYSSRAIWLRQRFLVITNAPYLQHITMPLFIHRFLSVKPQKTLTILHLPFEALPSCGIFFALSSSLCLLF